MTELAFSVTDRKVTRTDTARIVGDSIDEYTAEFTLDAMWTESIITSVWVKGGEAYKAILTDGVCNVPNEVLVGYGEVTVSLYAGDLRTTVPACIWVEKSGYIEGVTPATPTPSEYAQIVEAYNSKADKADTYTEDEVDAAVAEINETLSEKEDAANKVTSIDGDSTDEQYPSAKVVYAKIAALTAADIAWDDDWTLYDLLSTALSGFDDALAAKQTKTLYFSDITVSDWDADETYADYSYRASVALTDVEATMLPEVIYGVAEAASGNYAPVCTAYSGGVYLYAKVDNEITIPSIKCEVISS